AVGQHLRVGGIADARRPRSPVEGAVPSDLADPRAQDLRDQDMAVRQRRVAVGQTEALWRTVGAKAGATELTPDGFRVAFDADDAAVTDVRDAEAIVGLHVGVIRTIEIASGRTRVLGNAVLPDDPAGGVVHQHDGMRFLF